MADSVKVLRPSHKKMNLKLLSLRYWLKQTVLVQGNAIPGSPNIVLSDPCFTVDGSFTDVYVNSSSIR